MFNRRIVGIGLLCCMVSGCWQKPEGSADAKGRLTEYISKSFAVRGVQDRDELLSFLTGEAKIRLAAWSAEQFTQAFIDSKRQFIRLVFDDVKPDSANDVKITYELTYLDQGKGHDAKVTDKKLCELVFDKEKGRWYILEVHNIKELVEYRDEMAVF